MKNRYIFFRRLYKDYLLLFTMKRKLIAFNVDYKIISILVGPGDDVTEILDANNINYIIIDNLDILEKKCFINNNYNLYKKMAHLITISNKLIDKYYKDHTDNV